MKILLCIGFFEEQYFYRENYYVNGLAELGHEVHILTSNLSLPFKAKKRKKYKEDIEKISNNVYLHRCKALFYLKDIVFFRYKKKIKSIAPDVIHIIEARQYITYKVANYSYAQNIPFIYEHEQRSLGSGFAGRIKSIIFINRWLKSIVKKASKIRVVTKGGELYLLKYISKDCKNKIQITSLGYDSKKSFYIENAQNIFINKYSLNIKKNQMLIGITGKFDSQKKIEEVVKVFNKVKNDNLILVIVGIASEHYSKIIDYEINKNKLHIIWINKLLNPEELNLFYNSCDFLIWTRPTISYFEALATGTKIIIPYCLATANYKHDNIIFYGYNGCVSANKDIIQDCDKFELEISNIFSNLKKYDKQANNSDEYSVEKIVELLNENLEETLILNE